ncbi:MAG: hypothetical protein R2845_13885 [Thermomicrobiales bacterium]
MFERIGPAFLRRAIRRRQARVFGIDTRDHGPRRLAAHVGFVFQDPEAQGGCAIRRRRHRVRTFEQAGLPRIEMPRSGRGARFAGIAARSRDIATLSGGERQRAR